MHVATAALCALVLLFALFVFRAPGFRDYKLLAPLAGLAFVSSLSMSGEIFSNALVQSINLLCAVLWVILEYNRLDKKITQCFPYLIFLGLGFILSLFPGHHWIKELLLALLLPVVLTFLMAITIQARQKIGAKIRVLGLSLWMLACIVDLVIVLGFPHLPKVGTIGLSAGLFVLSTQLAVQAVTTASELHSINKTLLARVKSRTEDLGQAKSALMAGEKRAALGHLAASVGHEINNPLSYINGNLGFVRDSLSELTKTEDELVAIDDSLGGVERIRKIVLNLGLYAKNTPGDTTADLKSVMESALRIVTPQIRFAMSIDLSINTNDRVAISESRLIQVIVHLLLRTAHASDGVLSDTMPETQIRCERVDDKIVIRIHSDVPKKLLQFKKSPYKESDLEESTGLSLFVCSGILAAVGGRIEIESNDAAETIVSISLDRVPEASDVSAPCPAPREVTQ